MKQDSSQVQLMTQAGVIVTLLEDSQTPFARFIARSNTNWLKRMSVTQVYSEKAKSSGTVHPKLSTELAFDIVTPSPSLLSDGEVIATLGDILLDARLAANRPIILQISHCLLVKAILLHCAIPKEKHARVCHVLKDAILKSEGDLPCGSAMAEWLRLPVQVAETMLSLLQMEGTSAGIRQYLNGVIRPGEAADLVEKALNDLDCAVDHAVEISPKIDSSVHIKLALQDHISGVTFRFICQSRSRK